MKETHHIRQLNDLLDRIVKLSTTGGLPALFNMIDQVEIVQNQLKQSIESLKQKQYNLYNWLKPIYLASSNATFKNKLAAFAFRPFRDKRQLTEKLDSANYLLNIVKNTPSLAKEVDDGIKKQIQEIKSAVDNLIVKFDEPLLPKNIELMSSVINIATQESSHQSNSVDYKNDHWQDTVTMNSQPSVKNAQSDVVSNDDFNTFMQDVVMPDLEQSGSNNKPTIIPDVVLQQGGKDGWMGKIFGLLKQNNRQDEIDQLNNAVKTLQDELKDTKKTNTDLGTNIDDLQSQIGRLNAEKLNEAETHRREAETRRRIEDNMSEINKVISVFNKFYDHYSFLSYKGFLGMFSTHGNTGRETAEKFKRAFVETMNLLNLDQDSDIFPNQVKLAFLDLIQKKSALLSGGYRNHSFKTYMLAYDDYLNDNDPNYYDDSNDARDPVKCFHHDEYVDKAQEIETIYQNRYYRAQI